MSDGFSPYKQICECGHDKATHYFDEKGPGDCLGARCNCHKYRVEGSGEKNPKPYSPTASWDGDTSMISGGGFYFPFK